MGIHGTSSGYRNIQLDETKEQIVDFVRCSYLGLDTDPRLQQGAIAEIRRHNALHWSCARTRLNFIGVKELEEELSKLFTARAIVFPTVTQGNQAILSLLASGLLTKHKPDVVVFDKKAHASLAYHKPVLAEETKVVTVDHNNMEQLEKLCKIYQTVAFICDGIYSMGGGVPLKKISGFQEKYGLIAYIDDAHGVSIIGKNGRGFARSNFDDLGENTIIATSLGKGFGASGGVVLLGTRRQESVVRKFSRVYAFSIGPNVAAIGACKASILIHNSDEIITLQEKLYSNLAYFDSMFDTGQKGSISPIRIVNTNSEDHSIGLSNTLLHNYKLYVSAIFFPTVAKKEPGIRMALSAWHHKRDIKILCNVLNHIKQKSMA